MATQPIDAERTRDEQRAEWRAAAPGWIDRRQEVSEPSRSITEGLIAAAGISPGQRVLDLACGVGDPAFVIAGIVGDRGTVVGLDLTREMVDGARRWAQEHDIDNVEFRTISSELDLGVPDAAFDRAICRHGLMYMPDPSSALREIHRALKPAGRVAVSTWGRPERGPFLMVPMQIILRHVQLPPPDPTAPSPFALPTAEALESALTSAGFAEVETDTFDTAAIAADSPEAFWDLVAEMAGPVVALLASLPEVTRAAIRDDAIQTLASMCPDGPVSLSGEAVIASGVKLN